MNSERNEGWAWFETDPAEAELAPAQDYFVRTFASDAGRQVLAYLRNRTMERLLPPDASEAELRHTEGQRHLFRLIEHLASTARNKRTSHD